MFEAKVELNGAELDWELANNLIFVIWLQERAASVGVDLTPKDLEAIHRAKTQLKDGCWQACVLDENLSVFDDERERVERISEVLPVMSRQARMVRLVHLMYFQATGYFYVTGDF
jgi:hypothetical protein